MLQKYRDRIHIIGQKNQGSTFARNIGIKEAKGEYIVAFDHDDILLPYALRVYDEVINYYNHPPMIYSKIKIFEKKLEEPNHFYDGKNIVTRKFKNYFKKNIALPMINANMIAKRESILEVSGYQPNSFAYDDHRLLFRLGTLNPFIAITYPVTVGYRKHMDSWSRNAEYTAKGALALIKDERENTYPGGKRLKLDRRGLIGSNLLNNFKLKYFGLKDIKLILRIILAARTMLLVAFIRKFFSYFYKYEQYIIELK
jgi:glycosyltransferase involved in cell wall biosynthesis